MLMSNLNKTQHEKRILITGANGFTGFHACDYFAHAGYKVYALVRNSYKFPHKYIKTVLCNLMDKQTLNNVVASVKPDFVLHLAGQNAVQESWSSPVNTIESNVIGTLYLLDAIRTGVNNCRTIIVGSILQSNPLNPSSFQHPYGLSKTMQTVLAEAYAFIYDLDVLIVKPSNLIGPGNSAGVCSQLAQKVALMEKGKEEKRLIVNNLLAKRDFLDVRDAVKAYEILFSKGSIRGVYEITSGKTKSIGDITDQLNSMAKVDFKIESQINQQESISTFNPSALKTLGWAPSISFKQSMFDILNFQRIKVELEDKSRDEF